VFQHRANKSTKLCSLLSRGTPQSIRGSGDAHLPGLLWANLSKLANRKSLPDGKPSRVVSLDSVIARCRLADSSAITEKCLRSAGIARQRKVTRIIWRRPRLRLSRRGRPAIGERGSAARAANGGHERIRSSCSKSCASGRDHQIETRRNVLARADRADETDRFPAATALFWEHVNPYGRLQAFGTQMYVVGAVVRKCPAASRARIRRGSSAPWKTYLR
jgi:hypothetical protein